MKAQHTIPNISSFSDIPLELPDVFRGQYYIESLEKESKNLISFLNAAKVETSHIEILLKPFFSSLAEVVDQMILPVITYEMAIAKQLGLLSGKDGGSRYESFFVDGSKYTCIARSVPVRYPLLFKMIDTVIHNTLNSALDCIEHLIHDLPLLQEHLFIEGNDFLAAF
jgi:lantibiotic modifying enzyme